MYTMLMDVLCLDCYSDLLLNQGANIEMVVESTIGLLLLDFLGGVITIEKVLATCVPATLNQLSEHRLHMRATSSSEGIDMSLDLLTARLDEAICCALLDHFHIVVMNVVDVQPQAQ